MPCYNANKVGADTTVVKNVPAGCLAEKAADAGQTPTQKASVNGKLPGGAIRFQVSGI